MAKPTGPDTQNFIVQKCRSVLVFVTPNIELYVTFHYPQNLKVMQQKSHLEKIHSPEMKWSGIILGSDSEGGKLTSS